GLVPECLGEKDVRLIASLRAERTEAESMLLALGAEWANGREVSWKGVLGEGCRRVELPTYAWQRERYWIESTSSRSRVGESTGHPLLGVRLAQAGAEARYESVLSRWEHGFLYEHRVGGKALMPAAGLAELVRAAAEHVCEGEAVEMVSLAFQAP